MFRLSKPGKPGILTDFSERGKLKEFSGNSVQPQGKIVTNKVLLVRHSKMERLSTLTLQECDSQSFMVEQSGRKVGEKNSPEFSRLFQSHKLTFL